MKIFVYLTTSFPAWHCWPKAPRSCGFLKHKHHHIFHVKIKWEVNQADREIEFITKRQEVDKIIHEDLAWENLGSRSCEELAMYLYSTFDADFVRVSEDGQYGAEVVRDNLPSTD